MARVENKLEEISGEIIQIKTSNETWFAGVVYDGKKNVSISGNVGIVPPVGSTVVFGGKMVSGKFGPEFKIQSVVNMEAPKGRDGAIAFLETLDNISKVRARMIVSVLGDDTISLICNDPDSMLRIPGLGKKLVASIGRQLIAKKATMDCEIKLIAMKIPTAVRSRIVDIFGNKLKAIIDDNPYELTVVEGVSFAKIDSWVLVNKVMAPDSVERGAAILVESLKIQAENGHTCQDLRIIMDGARKITLAEPFPSDRLKDSLDYAVSKRMVENRKEGFGLRYLIEAEETICRILRKWINNPCALGGLTLAPKSITKIMTDEQKSAIESAAQNRVTILTGGPGTGKTLTSKGILGAFPRTGVAVIAPTGKAAKRARDVTGINAMTIHRFIGTITAKLNNPNECIEPDEAIPQVVLIDETSMVDVKLLSNLLKLLDQRTNARLVIVGDVDQLPSIGPGQALFDLIACGAIPVTVLTKVMRQKGADNQIVDNAYLINNGSMPDNELRPHRQWLFGEAKDIPQIHKWIASFLTERAAQMGFDPIKDVQVLTGQRQKELGCDGLNNLIRECLNPPARNKAEIRKKVDGNWIITFREGDKVMSTENNQSLGVVNGDQGIVHKINLVNGKPNETTVDVMLDSGELVVFRNHELTSLVQAWAITVHKSQGSEYPVVIMICHESLSWSLQRALLYTGVTRGKKHVVVFGTKAAIKTAVSKERDLRMTRLISLFSYPISAE